MYTTLFKIERSRWAIRLLYNPHDLWVGLCWRKFLGPRVDLSFSVIPTIVLRIEIVYLNIFKD